MSGQLTHGLVADLRSARRSLLRRPWAFGAMVAALAISVGVNTEVFTLLDRVVFHPLSAREPSRLVTLWRTWEFNGAPTGSTAVNWDAFSRLREPRLASVEDIAVFTTDGASSLPVVLDDDDLHESLSGAFVTANYFRVLGLGISGGRDFADSDDVVGAEPVAILSHAVWRTRFGGSQSAIGRIIQVNGQLTHVVGVAAAGFGGTGVMSAPAQIYLPLMTASRLAVSRGTESNGRGGFSGRLRMPEVGTGASQGSSTTAAPAERTASAVSPISPVDQLTVIGRLTAEATLGQAEAEILSRLEPAAGRRLVPVTETMLPFQSRSDVLQFLWLLTGAVALTLAVGCASVGGMLASRVDERHTELAVRAALGASSVRLMRQMMVEAATLGVFGFAGAVLVAQWMDALLSRFAMPGGIAVDALRSAIDLRAIGFAMATTVVVVCVLSVMPVVRLMRRDLLSSLTGRITSSERMRLSRALVGVQIALGLCLLVAAMLFVRALSNALSTDLGFETRGLVNARVAPIRTRGLIDVPAESRARDEIVRELSAMPGVRAVTLGPVPLLDQRGLATMEATVDQTAIELTTPLELNFIAADYFEVLGQPLVQGRDFTEGDNESSPKVAILSETAAKTLWPGTNPIGHILDSRIARPATVIGIARDVRTRNLRVSGSPAVYFPAAQNPALRSDEFRVLLRIDGRQTDLAAMVGRAAVRSNVRLLGIEKFDDGLQRLLMPQRLGSTLLTLLSVATISVTLIAVYGLMASLSERMRRDIGIRLALGAAKTDIVVIVTTGLLWPLGLGVIAGAFGAWWGGRFADRFMYGLHGTDVPTIIAASTLIIAVAALAAFIPTRRATQVDPIVALRHE